MAASKSTPVMCADGRRWGGMADRGAATQGGRSGRGREQAGQWRGAAASTTGEEGGREREEAAGRASDVPFNSAVPSAQTGSKAQGTVGPRHVVRKRRSDCPTRHTHTALPRSRSQPNQPPGKEAPHPPVASTVLPSVLHWAAKNARREKRNIRTAPGCCEGPRAPKHVRGNAVAAAG